MKYLLIEIYLKVCALSKKTEVKIQIKGPDNDSLLIRDFDGKTPVLLHKPSQGSPDPISELDYLENHPGEFGEVTIIKEGIEIKTYPSFETFCKDKGI